MNAAAKDHHDCIDKLIQAGTDVNQQDCEGRTPLVSAAFFGSVLSLKKLLSAGADVNASHYHGVTALIASMYNVQRCCEQLPKDEERRHSPTDCKQKDCVKILIEAGANVNSQTDSGISALIKASANGYKECVCLLLEAGGDVNEVGSSGWTPLSSSVFYGSTECLQKLLIAGAGVNLPGYEGRTPLIECLWISKKQRNRWYKCDELYDIPRGYRQKECVKMLIESGASVNVQTDDGISALMKASESGYEECVKLLLETGADVNATSKKNCTSLIYSAEFGHEACLGDLLTAGADVNTKEKSFGATALIIASTCGHDKCVKSLVEVGADMNVKDNDGCTALIQAASFVSFKCIEHLLNAGADVNATTTDVAPLTVGNVTALMQASGVYSGDYCRRMIEDTGNTYFSKNHSVLKSIEALIKAGTDVNIKDDAGNTPLMRVIERGHKECIPPLLAAGADVNPALMVAIKEGNDETFDQLIKAGADVNFVNNTSETALLTAAVMGNVRAAKRLLEANCRINITTRVADEALMTRLNFRAEHGNIVKLLFAAGEFLILSKMISQYSQHDNGGGGGCDQIPQYLQDLISGKMQLDHICREMIRNRLLKLHPHQNLFSKISHMKLPEPLKRYLLHGQSLDDDSEGDGDHKSDDGSKGDGDNGSDDGSEGDGDNGSDDGSEGDGDNEHDDDSEGDGDHESDDGSEDYDD